MSEPRPFVAAMGAARLRQSTGGPLAESADYDLVWSLVSEAGPGAVAALDRVTRQIAAEASERIEPGAEATHRDDLARDAARLWAVARQDVTVREVLPGPLRAALDRLADGYGAGR